MSHESAFARLRRGKLWSERISLPEAVHDTHILDFHQSHWNGQTRRSISEAAASNSGSDPEPVGRESLESISVSRRDYGDAGVPSGLRYGLEGLSPHRLFGFLRISRVLLHFETAPVRNFTSRLCERKSRILEAVPRVQFSIPKGLWRLWPPFRTSIWA